MNEAIKSLNETKFKGYKIDVAKFESNGNNLIGEVQDFDLELDQTPKCPYKILRQSSEGSP